MTRYDGDHNDDNGSKTSTSSLLRIIALAARSLRTNSVREDGADALKTLREARSLTRPWLRDVKAKQAEGRRGLRASLLNKTYDKVRDFYDEAGEEIERLKRKDRKKHRKHRHKHRHGSRDHSDSTDDDHKKRLSSSRDPTEFHGRREPYQAPPPPAFRAIPLDQPAIDRSSTQINQPQPMLEQMNEDEGTRPTGMTERQRREASNRTGSLSSPRSPGPELSRPSRHNKEQKRDTSSSSKPSTLSSWRTSSCGPSHRTLKPTSPTQTLHRTTLPVREPVGDPPRILPSVKVSATSRPLPVPQQSPQAYHQPTQFPAGAQWPQYGFAGPGPSASNVPHNQANGPPQPQAWQQVQGQGADMAGTAGTAASTNRQRYGEQSDAGGPPHSRGLAPAEGNPPPGARSASGSSAGHARGYRPGPSQPLHFPQPVHGGAVKPASTMQNNIDAPAASEPAATTPRSATLDPLLCPGAETNPAYAWRPSQSGLAPNDDGRSSRTTRPPSLASWADSLSTLTLDDASHYFSRQHRRAKGTDEQFPEPQITRARPDGGYTDSQASDNAEKPRFQGWMAHDEQAGSQKSPGLSREDHADASEAGSSWESSSSSGSHSSTSTSSSEGDPSSSSRTAVRPWSAQQAPPQADQGEAAQGSRPAPTFRSFYSPSANPCSRVGVPRGSGRPENAPPQAHQQPYVPLMRASIYAQSQRAGQSATSYGTRGSQAGVSPAHQQRSAAGISPTLARQPAGHPVPPGSVVPPGHATGPAVAASANTAVPSFHASAAQPVADQVNPSSSQRLSAQNASSKVSTVDMGFVRPVLKKKCHHEGSQVPTVCDSVASNQDSSIEQSLGDEDDEDEDDAVHDEHRE
ncbi:hypothetical protein LTR78_005122 [Recurvomyces mirabilis]|uniref:Uncharacterized protein n=1 Tax=Recurvomyces mirabilis TaxID=574656 RepID=A0AAE0WNW1_9PEZI|nr:hypothetical protein LTR78_005122 [Recurvomyces mirabilis]KAK5158264.1 hypothetical protein LTS14_003282 [Recurvomyces mirabilis]